MHLLRYRNYTMERLPYDTTEEFIVFITGSSAG